MSPLSTTPLTLEIPQVQAIPLELVTRNDLRQSLINQSPFGLIAEALVRLVGSHVVRT